MTDDQMAALADALLAARARAELMALPSGRPAGLTLADAYQVAEATAASREAAGERPAGWKIGFTNRSIWARYQVFQPIWARVWDTTLSHLKRADVEVEVPLAGLVQPRLEPEIVFGFKADADAGMDEAALLDSIHWVAHGVEIVHTHYDGWRFGGAPDTVADFGLHGSLHVGPRVPPWPGMAADLAALTLRLHRGEAGAEQIVDLGQGALVLDGPVQALREWLGAMAAQTPHWRVSAGDVVTTGTLTDAWPVRPGERWRTELDDPRLPGLTLRFVG